MPSITSRDGKIVHIHASPKIHWHLGLSTQDSKAKQKGTSRQNGVPRKTSKQSLDARKNNT